MKKGYTPNPYSRKHKGKPVKMGETAEASADYLEKEQWGKQREEKEYRTDPNNTKTEGRYKGVEITIDEVEAAVEQWVEYNEEVGRSGFRELRSAREKLEI